MKKSNLLILLLLVSVLATAQQSIYIFSKKGGFKFYLTEEVDSVVFVRSPQVEEALSDAIFYEVYYNTSVVLNQEGTVYSNRHNDCGIGGLALMSDLNGPDMYSLEDGYNWFQYSSDYSDRYSNYAISSIHWDFFYKKIDACNRELRIIGKNSTNTLLNYEKAQLLTMRAYCYLSMAPYYQHRYSISQDKPCIPIYTEDIREPAPRATVREVYEQIVKDLKESIEYFKVYSVSRMYYIDLEVAEALLARAYLYMEKWDLAADYAEKVIKSGRFSPYSMDDLKRPAFVYAFESGSWIWGAPESGVAGVNSWSSHLSSFSGYSYTQLGMFKTINSRLYELIPETDIRKGWWIDESYYSPILDNIIYNGVSGMSIALSLGFSPYTNVKFGMKYGLGDKSNKCDWCLIRIEEMYLICAEAFAMNGNLSAGLQYLRDFMSYRDPNYSFTPTSMESFRDEIWKQRRIEFWGEGLSFADMMRMNKNMVRVSSQSLGNAGDYYQYAAFNLPAGDPRLLWPIPDNVISVNPKLVQQPDYGAIPIAPFESLDLKDGVTDTVFNVGITYDEYLYQINSSNIVPKMPGFRIRIKDELIIRDSEVLE